MIEHTQKGPGSPSKNLVNLADKPLKDVVIVKSGEILLEEAYHNEL